jgi:DNA invertase Pin-like site-specific DNA recombinase
LATIGYVRVSTEEQHLDLQLDALEAAACERVFTDDGVSAIAKKRPGFEAALAALKDGDTFIIWKMDRAFRSLRHALDVLDLFEQRGIQFCSLTDQIDTTTPMGKCMYQIRNAFAELERNLISERTKAGMAAAKKRGVVLGRPRKLSLKEIAWARQKLTKNPPSTLNEIATKLGVSVRTLSRALSGNTK